MDDTSKILQEYRQRFKKEPTTALCSKPVEVVTTGWLGLDYLAVRRGGIPRGMAMELSGKNQSGKSTLAAAIAGKFISRGMSAAYFDIEGRQDPQWLAQLGVDTRKLVLLQESKGTDAIDEVKFFVANDMDLVILDSMNFLNPPAIMDRENQIAKMNEGFARPRMLNDFARDMLGGFKLDPKDKTYFDLRKSKTCLLLLNHLFDHQDGWISMQETPGGEGLKNFASVRLFLSRKTRKLTESEDGSELVELNVRCVKNSIAPAFGECKLIIDQTKGVVHDSPESVVDVLEKFGLVTVQGSRYYIKAGVGVETVDQSIQGKENLAAWYEQNSLRVRAKIGGLGGVIGSK